MSPALPNSVSLESTVVSSSPWLFSTKMDSTSTPVKRAGFNAKVLPWSPSSKSAGVSVSSAAAGVDSASLKPTCGRLTNRRTLLGAWPALLDGAANAIPVSLTFCAKGMCSSSCSSVSLSVVLVLLLGC